MLHFVCIFSLHFIDLFEILQVLTDIGSDTAPILIAAKPVGSPAAHSLTITPTQEFSTNRSNSYTTDLSNAYPQTGGIVRETKTIQKTEVLHVDTNTEPMA